MTARQLYEGVLIELNKENAPNILLEDFNYFANKAINNYINKRYNIYDINQLTTDDLRVLKATAILNPVKVKNYEDLTMAGEDKMATYEVIMPSDYLHILNCICIYRVNQLYKCYNQNDTWRAAARRLTADMYSLVLDNFWNRPTYKRPYYYIHNVNTVSQISTGETRKHIPTNIKTDPELSISDYIDGSDYDANTGEKIINDASPSKTVELNVSNTGSMVERAAGVRYGNVSEVRCEIRYGTDNSIFELKSVYIDYIKAPQEIRLTQQQIDRTNDTSQMLEYPDYVCQEIINELVHLVMENISDLRLQTHPVVTLSIANPAQQLTEPVALQLPT